MTTPCDYVELRARSAFSFLEGAATPEDLIDRAAALGYPALALGDRDGLYGAPRFYHAAVRAGIKAIVGADLTLEDECAGVSFARNRNAAPARLYLLVPDRARYKNLCRMITTSKLRVIEEAGTDGTPPKFPEKGQSRIRLDDLERFGAGLISPGRRDFQSGLADAPAGRGSAAAVRSPACDLRRWKSLHRHTASSRSRRGAAQPQAQCGSGPPLVFRSPPPMTSAIAGASAICST